MNVGSPAATLLELQLIARAEMDSSAGVLRLGAEVATAFSLSQAVSDRD